MTYIGQLPGLYWDEEKLKYFPITKKKPRIDNIASTPAEPARQIQLTPNLIKNPHRFNDAINLYHQTLNRRLKRPPNVQIYSHFYPISAAASLAERTIAVATSQLNSQLQKFNLDTEERKYILESSPGSVESLIAIDSNDNIGVVKVAYKSTNLYKTDFDGQSLVHVHTINNSNYFDSDFFDRNYLLAVDKTLNRINQRREFVKYKSDVVSLSALTENETLCGLRNGNLHLHDWRMGNRAQPSIYSFDRTVNRLKRLKNGNTFVISTMNDDLLLYDIRMNKLTSSLKGNVNKTVLKQPFSTILDDSHLVVVGEDTRMRTWSLRTSELINSEAVSNVNYINNYENNLLICKSNQIEYISL